MRKRHVVGLLAGQAVAGALVLAGGVGPASWGGGPAAACTGPPVFDENAVTIWPEENATVPRNARVWFMPPVPRSLFGFRPTEPATLKDTTSGSPVAVVEKTTQSLRFGELPAGHRFELWLPAALTDSVIIGATPGDKAKAARARSFMTSDVIDSTAPTIRKANVRKFLPAGPTSCGPSERVVLDVDAVDASPVLVELVAVFSDGMRDRMQIAPIVGGTVTVYDVLDLRTDRARPALAFVLVPIDIAGNRGTEKWVGIPRAAPGKK